MTPTSTELFGERVRRMIVEVGQEFKNPDDDWVSVLFFEDEDGYPGVVPLPGEAFANDDTKDVLVVALTRLLEMAKAKRYALLLNAWMLRSSMPPPTEGTEEEKHELAKTQMLSEHAEWTGHYDEHPDSVEVLWVMLVDREHSELWMAEIKRNDETPPTLDEWRLMPGGAEGRFVALASALQED